MKITVPNDVERALTAEASKLGATPEQLAVDSLRERFPGPEPAAPLPAKSETLADFLEGYIGVLHGGEYVPGGARMSDDCGRKFAAGLVAPRNQQNAGRAR